VPPSRRVQALAALFCSVIAASLAFAPGPAAVWRALAGLCTAALLWQPLGGVIFQSGASAVRRLSWEPDGRWSIVLGDGLEREVALHPSSAALGPWLLLAWSVSRGPLARRSHALIDAASVSPVTFRALRGRLKLEVAGTRERRRASGSRLN